eukprot:TRINITY_DN30325_c0_g1_i1.p1 TRINITY_DN30325_c0_g1~~TRINITY_DN30325_c0_g1_i1.p1  ORF type:complete len:238 (+),score=51.29 TRINITY_DN30325_c0_g1_i1:80-793(+)
MTAKHRHSAPLLRLAAALSLALLGAWLHPGTRARQATTFLGGLPGFGGDEDEKQPKQESKGESAPQDRTEMEKLVESQREGSPEKEPDWREIAKEESYQRQLQRLEERQRRASPNYKETAEERKKRLQKMALWQSSLSVGTDDVVGKVQVTGQVIEVKVTLPKPLGIDFVEYKGQEGKHVVKQVTEGGSAYRTQEVEAGDCLYAVNDFIVEGIPFDSALQYIIDAQGDVKLTFKRTM